jgi:hypothetical protein
VVKSEMQTGFPKQYKLLPVKMYALRPKIWTLLQYSSISLLSSAEVNQSKQPY